VQSGDGKIVITYTVVPPTKADLSVTKSDSPDPAKVGKTLKYTIKVKNNGPQTASGVVLTDTLPTSVMYVSTSSTQGSCSISGNVVTCQLGAIAKNRTATVTITVKPTQEGMLSNTAEVSSSNLDLKPNNNRDTESTRVGSDRRRRDDD
jgi:uncharacterized repeat protein (TIGR01451 family)